MVKREQIARNDALKRLAYMEGRLKAIRQEGRDAVLIAQLVQLFALSRG